MVFDGENLWRSRVDRDKGEGGFVGGGCVMSGGDGGCVMSGGDGGCGGGWAWW